VELSRLLHQLVLRELKARYKNSVWVRLESAESAGHDAGVRVRVHGDDALHAVAEVPIFFLCGYLPWQFFSGGVMTSISSVVANSNLVKKVYFPRGATDIYGVSGTGEFPSGVGRALRGAAGHLPRLSPYIWLLPVVIFIQTCFVLGVSLFLGALNVFYRDTILIMDVVMQAWFFLTPVFYPIELLPRSLEVMGVTLDVHRLMYILNPMASLITAYRDLLYWGYKTDLDFLLRTALTVMVVLAVGYWVFARLSPRFAEEV
jgi:ABC-type polysaccharide/polyol phosphate export permease